MNRAFGSFAARLKVRRDNTARQKATMAQLVSDGWSITAAGRHLGVKQGRSSQIWKQIVAEMGAQAI